MLAPQLLDPRIRLIENEGRKLAGAFNTGMRHATTAFVAILLGDDMWAPEAIGVLGEARSTHPAVDFFHSTRRVIDDDGVPISRIYDVRHDVTLADFEAQAPVKHLLCWRRLKGLEVGGMDESLNCRGPTTSSCP